MSNVTRSLTRQSKAAAGSPQSFEPTQPHDSQSGFVSGFPESLIDEHETAEILNLKVATLRRWRWAGRNLPFIKLGSAVRYSKLDVYEYIAASRRRSTTDDGQVAR